jgi:ferrous iron transport protein A
MNTSLTLDQLGLGESAVIESFTDKETSLKLMEMGCVPGEKIKLDKTAPLGDPIAFHVAGYILSMRRSEAATVRIKSEKES